MEPSKSIEIIESMLGETRKSLHRNSFYFIMWGLLMAPAGIAESLLITTPYFWIVWPITGTLGGIISFIYGRKQSETTGVQTAADRITSYTWGAFLFTLIFAIAYSVSNGLSPHTLVLMLAGSATFISGGISKFKPFIYGGLVLEIGALACAFAVPAPYQGYVSAVSLTLGYVIPGIILRKSENV